MMTKTIIIAIVAVLVAMLAASIATVRALHEDEAGKYDWLLQRIGTPTHAALVVTPTRKAAFVATDANVVAAMKLKSGGYGWRRVFGEADDLVCLAAAAVGESDSNHLVVTVTSAGTVHFLRGKDGIPAGNSFSLAGERIAPVTCFATDDNKIFVVGRNEDNNEMNVYAVDVENVKVSPLMHLPTPSPVATVALARKSAASPLKDADANEMLVVLADGRHNWVRLRSGVALREWSSSKSSKSLLTQQVWRAVTTDGESPTLLAPAVAVDGKAEGIVSVAGIGATPGKASPATAVVDCDFGTQKVTVAGVASNVKCDSASDVALLAVVLSGDTPKALFTTRHDGAVHFVSVKKSDAAVTTQWTSHEGMAFPRDVTPGSEFRAGVKSNFGLSTPVYVLSRYEHLYRIDPVTVAGAATPQVAWVSDVRRIFHKRDGGAADASSTEVVSVRVVDDQVVVKSRAGEVAKIAFETGAHQGGPPTISRRGFEPGQSYFDLNTAKNELVGYEILKDTQERVDMWRIRVQGTIAAIAAGHDPLDISSVDHYLAVPNRTSSTTEIRRRYPMANVIVLATHDALDALTVTAIDALSGATLASARHTDAPGDVKLVAAEHSIVYHFFNRAKRRYYVATWELFEHQGSVLLDSQIVSPALVATSLVAKRRVFHSPGLRAPHVVTSLRMFPHGPLAVLGVAHTAQSIARKLLVFVQPNGEAMATPLPALWAVPLKAAEPKNEAETLQANSLVIGTFDRLTHVNRVARPTLFACAPTLLESTARIVVAGLDVWHMPTSAGKPFDRLDDEFNKRGLLMVCAGLPVVALVLRYFANKRAVNIAWS